MSLSLKNYIEILINPSISTSLDDKSLRWVYNPKKFPNKFSYLNKSKIPSKSIVKIESILKRISCDITKYGQVKIEKGEDEKISLLIRLVKEKVENYKKKHCKIYLIISRILFGNIDKISKTLVDQLEILRKDYQPQNANTEDKEESFHEKSSLEKLKESSPTARYLDLGNVGLANQKLGPVNFEDQYFTNLEFSDTDIDDSEEPFFSQLSAEDLKLFGNPQQESIKPIKKKPTPIVEQNIAVLLTPPVYKPQPSSDETFKLLNQLKKDRIKFYELFSQKIKLDTSHQEVYVPLIEIQPEGLYIRIPQQLKEHDPFCSWFEKLFKSPNDYEKKKPARGKAYLGIQYDVEYRLSLAEAENLIKEIPHKGITHLAQLTNLKATDLNVHPYSSAEIWGYAPSVEDTISLTLANLDPHLSIKLREITTPKPQSAYAIPLVEFDSQGLMIKIPDSRQKLDDLAEMIRELPPGNYSKQKELENTKNEIENSIKREENLKDLIKQIFGLEEIRGEESHFSRLYGYFFHVKRDEIENFLMQLGMDQIAPHGLHQVYCAGNITYIQHLIQTGKYHAYRAVRMNDAVESIQNSLANLVPNKTYSIPHVSYHPRGWLSIKLKQNSQDYNDRLIEFLGHPLCPIHQNFNREIFTGEIFIYDEMLPKFLKQLNLEEAPDNISYLDKLGIGKKLELENCVVQKDNKVDLLGTIALRLARFASNDKSDRFLPQVSVKNSDQEKGIEIWIPADQMMSFSPHPIFFGDYLSDIFGINAEEITDAKVTYLRLLVPNKRVKSFLERDLALRNLPLQKKNNIWVWEEVTYFKYFIQLYYPELYERRGKVINLSLSNPRVPIPSSAPEMSQKVVLEHVEKILKNHPKKETYKRAFEDTFKRINPFGDNPDLADYRAHVHSAQEVKKYLNLIMDVLAKDTSINDDRKREVMIEIAMGCQKNICLIGRASNLREIYQKLMCPELKNKVRAILLNPIDKFKNDVLAELFKKHQNGLHIVNLAKILWWEKFGLDEEAGKQDEDLKNNKNGCRENLELLYLQPETKQEFVKICKKNLFNAVVQALREDKDSNGSIRYLQEYQESLQQILSTEGLKPDQIDDEMERLLPNFDLTNEAVGLLLIHIGILSP